MFGFGKPSKKKFAELLLTELHRAGDNRQLVFDAESFSLVPSDGGQGYISLANIYHEHCTLPRGERKANLKRLAGVFSGAETMDLPEDFEDAKPHLRPKIWARATFAMMKLRQQFEGGDIPDPPLYPLGSHLYSTLVFDTEHAMRTLTVEELDDWGVTYYEALEIACQNLDESTLATARIGERFYSSATGDNYDSSRVLLTDRIRSFDVEGDHIAIVPQRDALFIAGSADETSLKILFELTEKTASEDVRPLSPLPLRLDDDGEWVDWIPPRNHTLRQKYDDLELNFLGSLYAEQKQLLDAMAEDMIEEDPAFNASFSALEEKDTERLRSYCVWGRGVDSLLPRTQLILLVGDDGMEAGGEWEHVASVVGDLLVKDDRYYPSRYRAREFPSEAQLAEIGQLNSD